MLKLENGGRPWLLAIALAIATLAPTPPLLAQNRDRSSDRKLITRVEPAYPETLKRLYIGGAVRVEAVIAPNGTVETTKLLGGNPILGQSAMKAIKSWKYAPANERETLVVKLEFNPYE